MFDEAMSYFDGDSSPFALDVTLDDEEAMKENFFVPRIPESDLVEE